jgi:hypothetical protein
MKIKSILQIVFNFIFIYFLFPSFNGFIQFLFSFCFFTLVWALSNTLFGEFCILVNKNYHKLVIRAIDTRETLNYTTKTHYTQLDIIGKILYYIYLFRHNYKRELNKYKNIILENIFISLMFILGLVVFFGVLTIVYYFQM